MSVPTLILLLLAMATVAVVAAGLVRTIRRDGYGRRPPPASHPAWYEVDGVASPTRFIEPGF